MTLNKNILHLALPAIASNITVPLLGLCDTAITGHLGSETYIAAIAAGSMMLNMLFWLCSFFRMGTTGLAAEAYGENSPRKQLSVLLRASTLALFISLTLVILSKPLSSILLSVINPSPESSMLAVEYFLICIWGAPPLLVMLSVNGWFIGMQNTILPMVISISMNIINVVASLVAVFILHLGFIGVAIGTLLSNWCALILALILLRHFVKGCGFSFRNISLSGIIRTDGFRKFFNVSITLFFRSACIMLVTVAVTSLGARMGDITLAANAIIMQLFLFFSYFIDGFAFAAEALCGKFFGEKDILQLKKTVRALLNWATTVTCLFLIIYGFAANEFISLLTDLPAVRQACADMHLFIFLLPLVSLLAFIFDGVYTGLTATWRMMITTFVAAAVFAVIAFILPALLSLPLNNYILWSAFLIYLFIRGCGLAIQLPSVLRAS